MSEQVDFELEHHHALMGPAAALGLMALWALGLVAWLSLEWRGAWWALAPLAVAAQTFLHTGLFITAHDAMHRVVCWRSRRLNDALGALALGCYALFSLKALRTSHRRHHAHPASPDDPDFHDGQRRGFWGWYATFIWRHLSLWQVVGMAAVFNVLAHGLGVPEPRLLVFWVAPALLSTLQLFYFGTYLPHRHPEGSMDRHRARSNAMPPWLSLLTCYHFGYHWEHHAYPHAPWWALASVRRQVLVHQEAA